MAVPGFFVALFLAVGERGKITLNSNAIFSIAP